MTTSQLFVVLGLASLVVAILIGRTMPTSSMSDALSIIYRALFRIEVKGLENLHNAGPNVIIALNHVSFLDAGLAMSLRSRKPVFAIDVGIAKMWWVRPFLKLTNALPLDPMKPMAVRTLIEAVRAGNALIIFPEGRITVTGSLMKVYDGAAMIADKADAEIVPVRIEGLEQTPFSRLSKGQVRRKWFPKVTVTVLEPVKLTVDPGLKGRYRRQAAGAALYGIMSDLVFRTTSTDRTVIQAVIEAAKTHGLRRVAVEDPVTGALTYKRPLVARKADDWAAILFTSGSEGVPKGVVLSHRNMLANAAQAAARIDFGRQDKVFNVLPVFHSFGLTVGVVLPLVSGVRLYLYPSPLHYRTVAELIYGVNATIMFGTDTFLAGYARSAHPYDFRSLRYILAGAEPVKESTRRMYMEKFGLRILEGYGVTETAPALALNTPMFNTFGTVGRLMPGTEARLDPVEGVEEGGRLWVRGPNVMLGYLKVENPGVLEPPAEGWHDTGDIVTIDERGFITIKGRAKRFAKIGGEMISLAAVETLASELWPNALSAVVSIPDMRKGERLILVTQQKNATRSEFQAFAKVKHASDLMIPAEVWVMDKLPVLGSGKVDQLSVAKLVEERVAAAPTAVARATG